MTILLDVPRTIVPGDCYSANLDEVVRVLVAPDGHVTGNDLDVTQLVQDPCFFRAIIQVLCEEIQRLEEELDKKKKAA